MELKKVCTKCKLEKALSEFNKAGKNKPGYLSTCKECKSAIKKKWYAEHKEEAKAYNQKWDVENAERRKGKRLEWQLANKGKVNEQERNYKANKRATNPLYDLAVYMANRIRDILNDVKVTESIYTNVLGCSKAEFLIHLESQFTDGMNWSNRGEWEIDHILPMASAKTKREIYKLNHYTNLRPLWKKENRAKSNNIIQEADDVIFSLFKVDFRDSYEQQLADINSFGEYQEQLLGISKRANF